VKNLRQITSISLLGSLWCIVEIYGDLLLRSLQIPMRGAFLMSFGVIILSVARFTIPGQWVILILGMLTASLKLLVLGVLSIWPSLGILIETFLVQILFFVGKPGKIQVICAGTIGVIWSFFHPFLTQGLIAGVGIYQVYIHIVEKSMQVFTMDMVSPIPFILLWFILHVAIGLISGILAWQLVKTIHRRVTTVSKFAPISSSSINLK
jgi:hypothetical protein